MKKMVSLLVILAILAVGLPYFFGREAETQYRKYIDLISLNSSIPLKVSAYDRGIWSSKAITEIPVGGPFILKFHHRVLHGPVMFDRTPGKPKGFQWGMALVASAPNLMETQYGEVHKAFGDEDPISWKSLFAFNGNVQTFIHSPAKEYTAENGATINWQGLEGQFTTDLLLVTLKGKLNIPGLKAKSGVFDGGIQGFSLEVDEKRSESNLWVGKVLMAVDNVLLNEPQKGFELTTIKIDGESSEQNRLFNVLWTFDLTRAVMPSGTYGPMEILVRLLNMDSDAMNEIQHLSPGTAKTQEIPKPIIRKLLEKNPTLVIENSKLTLPEGDVLINAKFSMGGANIPETFDDSIYLKTLNGDLDALLPKSLLEKAITQHVTMLLSQDPQYSSMLPDNQKAELQRQTDQKIEKYKQEGLVMDKEDRYEVKFSVKDGKIMANGKEVPLSGL